MDGQAYTQGTDYQIAGTTTTTGTTGTTTYKTEQYNYQYQYQMPTKTTTTTTTQHYTTKTPVAYSQQYTTSTPVTYSEQQYTTSTPVTYTQQYTTQQPVYTTTKQTTTYTTTAPTTSVSLGAAPAVKLLRKGSGISPNELNGIVSTSMAIFQQGIVPISNNTAARIKKALGGDWLVIVYPKDKPIDFNMTCVQGNDYLYFTLDNLAYQVCRLR